MAAKKHDSGIEWVGGVVALAKETVRDELGLPFQPTTFGWLGSNGELLAFELGKAEAVAQLALHTLSAAIARPMVGSSHRPARVRVESTAVADALRIAHPDIEVVCGPAPELIKLRNAQFDLVAPKQAPKFSLLGRGTEASVIAAHYAASAALYRAQPWDTIAPIQQTFLVAIDKLDLKLGGLLIGGPADKHSSFSLFETFEDLIDHLNIKSRQALDPKAYVPGMFVHMFVPAKFVPEQVRNEVQAHNWELADAAEHPLLKYADSDGAELVPSTSEYVVAEAVTLAIAQLAAEVSAFSDERERAGYIRRAYACDTTAGKVTVRLTSLKIFSELKYDEGSDLQAEFAKLDPDDELQEIFIHRLSEELLRRFRASPEAQNLAYVDSCDTVLEFAETYFEVNIFTMTADDLDEVLFDILPRKLSASASDAADVVRAMRALYMYMARALNFDNVEEYLELLGPEAETKLTAEMADTSNFGPAKSMAMAAHRAGVSLDDRAGLDAWIKGKSTDSFFGLPAAPPKKVSPLNAKAKKQKRKATRKARHKSR
jgi:hypothetical protein